MKYKIFLIISFILFIFPAITLAVDVAKDLDLRHTEGSLLSRQLKALREYAQDDPKLTEILRSLSLL